MSEKVIRLTLGVMISGLMARHLGVDNFGELNYLLSLLIIFIAISTLGLNRIVVREVAKKSELNARIKKLISTGLKLRLITSLIIIFSSSLLFYYLSLDNIILHVLVLCSLLFTPFDILEQTYQGLGKFKQMSLARTISFLISSAVRLVLIYFDAPLIYFVACILLEYMLISTFFLSFFIKGNSSRFLLEHSFSKRMSKRLLKESWPEIIAGLGAILFMKSDQLMLYWLGSYKEVGIYSAASRISEAWYFVPMAIVASTFPPLVKKKEEGHEEEYKHGIKLTMCMLVYFGCLIGIFVSLVGPYIIQFIYGEGYTESSIVLSIHVWAGVFFCYGITSGSWLAAEKKLKYNLYRNSFGIGVNCILNIMLIPYYGAIGAAVAMVAGMFSAYLLFDYFVPELKTISRMKRESVSILFFADELKNTLVKIKL